MSRALPESLRQCAGANCKKIHPLTKEFFQRVRTCRNGWSNRCRDCMREQKNKWSREKRRQEAKRRARLAPPPLRQGQLCPACAGMAHRVTGDNCRRCGLAYMGEPRPELQTRRSYEAAV